MKKTFFIATGEYTARHGGGWHAEVCPTDQLPIWFRSTHASVREVEVTFNLPAKAVGSEGSISGYDYTYLVFNSFDVDASNDVKKAISKHITDSDVQASLVAQFKAEQAQPVLNLTQHVATAEQTEAGVVEPADKKAVQTALTFDDIPSSDDVFFTARELASIAYNWRFDLGLDGQSLRVMIGGAPFLMSQLEAELQRLGFVPVYAFSKRVSEESLDSEGNVVKTNVFKHVGFVDAI